MNRPDEVAPVPVCSVVIPTYNGRALLEICLESIDRCRPRDLPIEVIVADAAELLAVAPGGRTLSMVAGGVEPLSVNGGGAVSESGGASEV